ncbi:NAD(P)H-dependent oxidoreductase [Aerococcaceae bacterium DSM 111020]|nr:NAD(P)H-dependent oxidoreductase [Aerococcaceae bacterium DSM 111020]
MIKIGIITGSTREGRVTLDVANWVLEISEQYQGEAEFELVDIAEYDLPLINTVPPLMLNRNYEDANTTQWSQKIDELDGFIFVTPEYNKTISPALANALDVLGPEWNNKAAGIVGYGSTFAVSAAQVLRLKLANLQIATVASSGALSIMTDFVDMTEFKPADYNVPTVLNVIDQTVNWAKALKTLR